MPRHLTGLWPWGGHDLNLIWEYFGALAEAGSVRCLTSFFIERWDSRPGLGEEHGKTSDT